MRRVKALHFFYEQRYVSKVILLVSILHDRRLDIGICSDYRTND
jgi:hypothetical protein